MAIEVSFSRRAAILTAALAFTAFASGCQHKEKGMSSMVNMADPTTAKQLISGFHGLESGAWRWTMQNFSVMLKPPAESDTKGATLRVRMYISPDQINRLGPITLSAEIGGQHLEPQTFSKDGDQLYSRSVPPELLKEAAVKVNFKLDKSRQPDSVDGRQLGVVVLLVGLQPR